MFRKRYTIEGKINKGFLIESNYLILQEGSFLKKINLSNGESIMSTKIDDGINIQKIEKFDNEYVGLANGEIYFLDKNLTIKNEKKINYTEYNFFESKYLIKVLDFDYATFKGKYGVFNLSSNVDLWEIDTGEKIKIISDYAFTLSFETIGLRDVINGNVKWSCKIDNGNLLPELIGVSNDLVIFGIQEKDKLIALDIETGVVIWCLACIPKGKLIKGENLYSFLVNFTKYSLSDGKVVDAFVNPKYFEEIGIESQRSNFVIDGNHLITTDWKKGIIGAFNMVTHQFDWIHTEEEVSFPSNIPIVYQAPYLLISDNKGVLHIFEKTTNELS